MNQEAEILDPLTKFVKENGDFALLLSYPSGLVKFHSSDNFKSYIDLFTHDPINSDRSESPSYLNATAAGSSNDHNPQYASKEDERGLIPLARALNAPTFELNLSSKQEVMNHLRTCFRELQQLSCKSVAKAWIKTIEPRKQTNYPYNRGDDAKPPWWPSHIRHCEPDHLIKSERIDLLINIVRHKDADVKSLRNATNRIPSLNEDKLKVLDEIYLLAKTKRQEKKGILMVSDFENGLRSAGKKSPRTIRGKSSNKVKKSTTESSRRNIKKVDKGDNTDTGALVEFLENRSQEEEEEEEDTTIAEETSPNDTDISSIAPSNISLVPPKTLHDGFLTTSPKNYTFRDIVHTTPNSIRTNDEHVLDHFPSYDLQFSPDRVDPEILEHSSHQMQQSPTFETDEHIVTEVLKIRDYNIKHSKSKNGAIKKRSSAKRPVKRTEIGTLGPSMYFMKPNEHMISNKVQVFNDTLDAEGDNN